MVEDLCLSPLMYLLAQVRPEVPVVLGGPVFLGAPEVPDHLCLLSPQVRPCHLLDREDLDHLPQINLDVNISTCCHLKIKKKYKQTFLPLSSSPSFCC